MNEKIVDVNFLEEKISEMKIKRDNILSQWAKEVCPHKVGDVVAVEGYSHKGKFCKIKTVSYKKDIFGGCVEYVWKVYGVVFKVDGSLGKQYVDWTQAQAEYTNKNKTGKRL